MRMFDSLNDMVRYMNLYNENINLKALLNSREKELSVIYEFADCMSNCQSWSEFLTVSKDYLDFRR